MQYYKINSCSRENDYLQINLKTSAEIINIIFFSIWVVFVLKKVSLKQNKSHSRSLDLHIVYVNEGLPE